MSGGSEVKPNCSANTRTILRPRNGTFPVNSFLQCPPDFPNRMFNPNQNISGNFRPRDGNGSISFLGENIGGDNSAFHKKKNSIYLEGVNFQMQPSFTRVAPGGGGGGRRDNLPILRGYGTDCAVFETLKPMILLLKIMGVFPIAHVTAGKFQVTPALVAYSVTLYLIFVAYVGYIKWDRVEILRSGEEGRFEEAVIEYLFSVYLVPILLPPITWYESKRVANVYTSWSSFEKVYKKVASRNLNVFQGNKPLLTTLAVPIVSVATMVATHITMSHFRFLQVLPYCYISTVTYIIGGLWYLHCDAVAKVATVIANDFEAALKNIGPAVKVAEYRSLWMLLGKISREVGLSSCYVMIFLNLYLFLIITLTIYGLLSQIQAGLGIKDIGLAINASCAIVLLYFICDEAHFASRCVKVHFQKKLLMVELSWMNDDAQQEINMFLKATEMNMTDMSLGGFFDMNRNLFKSLLATMVTYLVVLLQFQISIPEDIPEDLTGNATVTTAAPK